MTTTDTELDYLANDLRPGLPEDRGDAEMNRQGAPCRRETPGYTYYFSLGVRRGKRSKAYRVYKITWYVCFTKYIILSWNIWGGGGKGVFSRPLVNGNT